jgi:hypothetical protein
MAAARQPRACKRRSVSSSSAVFPAPGLETRVDGQHAGRREAAAQITRQSVVFVEHRLADFKNARLHRDFLRFLASVGFFDFDGFNL